MSPITLLRSTQVLQVKEWEQTCVEEAHLQL